MGDQLLPRLEGHVKLGEEVLREIFLRALSEVGEGGAKELGEVVKLSEWKPAIDAERVALESLPRAERNRLIPSVTRDMDRAFGRAHDDGTSLFKLLFLAGLEVGEETTRAHA